jgi:hypothetical protein
MEDLLREPTLDMFTGSSEEVTTAPPSELVSEFKRIEDINASIRKIVRSPSTSPTTRDTPQVEESGTFNFEL